MTQQDTYSAFTARLLRPKTPGGGAPWAFVVLPRDASAKLPRRGRLTVAATLNGHPFEALLEPDGQKSHWMRIDGALADAAGATVGGEARFEVTALAEEPEPDMPADLVDALNAAPRARATWEATTTLARVDWIHWITSARQARTRAKRISDACEMLASGKARVCCFDPSGVYSKALRAPEADDARTPATG